MQFNETVECCNGLHGFFGFVLGPGFVELRLLCNRSARCAAFEFFVVANRFVISARSEFVFGFLVELID